MEMPTCKEKGETGEHDGGGDNGGVEISPGVSKHRQQGGGDGEERCRNESSSDANALALLFSTACQMRFENLPTEEKQRPLNHSPSPIYTHSNTAQRTREVLLRLLLLSRCVFPGNWHSLLRQWKSTESSSVFQTTPTYGIDILTTLRGGKLKINI